MKKQEAMKDKIKREHHILPDFEDFLKELAKLDCVKRIIPWRISRQQKWTSQKMISISYKTISGFKLKLKKWATAQEVFVTGHCEEMKIKKILEDNF